MPTRIHTKFTAIALCGTLGLCILGSSAKVAEASPKTEVRPPAHHEQMHSRQTGRDERDRHTSRRYPSNNDSGKNNTYSEGDRNTAAIVSAVVGYAIGKAT